MAETTRRELNDGKRRAVEGVLSSPDGASMSAAEIARRCGTSRNFVNSIRRKAPFCNVGDLRTYRHKSGKLAVMRVDTIGTSRKRTPFSEDEESLLARVRGPCVYLVRAGSLTKIGFSRFHPRMSVQTIKIANPAAVLVATISNGDMPLKRRLHEMFAAKKVAGDWFDIDNEVFARLEEAL